MRGDRGRSGIPGRLGLPREVHDRTLEAARRLRKESTESEARLWERLRGGKLEAKFRRQHLIGPYITDFCCPQHRLIIEIDGPIHEEQRDRDENRQALLEARGYRFLRFTAAEVEQNLNSVLYRISQSLQEL